MTTTLAQSIKAVRSTLRRVPALRRDAGHQIAVRHVGIAALLLDKNEIAAREHFELARHAAQHHLQKMA